MGSYGNLRSIAGKHVELPCARLKSGFLKEDRVAWIVKEGADFTPLTHANSRTIHAQPEKKRVNSKVLDSPLEYHQMLQRLNLLELSQ
jgi:hypothetical protein